jgi:hypothetical protein
MTYFRYALLMTAEDKGGAACFPQKALEEYTKWKLTLN